MEIGKLIKKLLLRTCVFFALITLAYSLLMLVVNVGEDQVLFPALQLVLIFLFSMLGAFAGWIVKLERLPAPVRVLCHYALLTLSFYLCFLLPSGINGSGVMIGLVMFTLIYALVMGVIALFRRRFRANAERGREDTYQKQFQRKK